MNASSEHLYEQIEQRDENKVWKNRQSEDREMSR